MYHNFEFGVEECGKVISTPWNTCDTKNLQSLLDTPRNSSPFHFITARNCL